jgi:hypothetical protein
VLLLVAMNTMFDIAEARTLAALMHPPAIVFGMLGTIALAGALLAGYGMAGGRTRSWIHVVGFAATISVAIFVILNYEYPRLGVIRIDHYDQSLVALRASMK